jgi:signal peptidase II
MWGLFSNSKSIWVPKLITALAIIALGFVIYYFLKFTGRCAWELTGMAFIIGGAFSNILDRLIQGYVVDFLDFYIGTAHWPTFNIADSFITCGVILFAISIWTDKTNKEPITEKES